MYVHTCKTMHFGVYVLYCSLVHTAGGILGLQCMYVSGHNVIPTFIIYVRLYIQRENH